MNFDELDRRMRIFETAHDHCVLPGIKIVVRLDGRGFTRLNKEVHAFEAPFDLRFRDMMLHTVEHLMNVGFNVRFGYTQSDEISLLLSPDDTAFNRKLRKLTSVLAGEASAKFSLELGALACFDARVCQLPSTDHVVDYFRWRSEDAHRNSLSAHCYWLLRREGLSYDAATHSLRGATVADKNELLFSRGINFNELPSWQKRGTGLYWGDIAKAGRNPVTGQETTTTRRRIVTDLELPIGSAYSEMIRRLVTQ
jgi:tRNA(His) 5'-end guanylyltransferase